MTLEDSHSGRKIEILVFGYVDDLSGAISKREAPILAHLLPILPDLLLRWKRAILTQHLPVSTIPTHRRLSQGRPALLALHFAFSFSPFRTGLVPKYQSTAVDVMYKTVFVIELITSNACVGDIPSSGITAYA